MLSDERIERLLEEEKPEIDARALRTALTSSPPKQLHHRAKKTIHGRNGNSFVLHLRQSALDPYAFSVILAYLPKTGPEIILRRHNGRNHRHANKIEGTSFTNAFHVHQATERYQAAGFDTEGYAEPTDEFYDLATALDAMLRVAHFQHPSQTSFPP
jgi:hypothetical protein